MKYVGAAVLALVCSQAVYAENVEPIEIEGLSLLGTPATAKAMGFTDCKDKYDYYLCSRTIPTKVFGAKPKTIDVRIDGKNNSAVETSSFAGPKVSDLTPDKLSYRGVNLSFDLEERTTFEQNLLKAGWLRTGSLNTRNFYKPGVNASVKIYKFNAVMGPEAPAVVAKSVEGLEKKAEAKAASDSSSNSFIDSMKK